MGKVITKCQAVKLVGSFVMRNPGSLPAAQTTTAMTDGCVSVSMDGEEYGSPEWQALYG